MDDHGHPYWLLYEVRDDDELAAQIESGKLLPTITYKTEHFVSDNIQKIQEYNEVIFKSETLNNIIEFIANTETIPKDYQKTLLEQLSEII